MSSNKKRFSLGWITGIALGLGSSTALVFAVTIPNAFTDGTATSAAAVNANFTALKAAVDALENCPAGMTRAGSICIDTLRARASFTGCDPSGTTGCTVVPTNTGGAAATGMSWAQAARACANAGKRLPTPGEWAAAKISGVLNAGESADGTADYVGVLGAGDLVADPAFGGYVGSGLAGGAAGVLQFFVNATYNTTQAAFLGFRCAK
jgi:hypothetical protein